MNADRAAQVSAEARDGSKKAQVLALLRTPDGASVRELMDAMTWRSHTVRGFVSGTVVKKTISVIGKGHVDALRNAGFNITNMSARFAPSTPEEPEPQLP